MSVNKHRQTGMPIVLTFGKETYICHQRISKYSETFIKQSPIGPLASVNCFQEVSAGTGNIGHWQEIAILIFQAVDGMLPEYISDLFVVRDNAKNLRGTNKFVVPRKKTTDFG